MALGSVFVAPPIYRINFPKDPKENPNDFIHCRIQRECLITNNQTGISP